jgi:hypothetical protein
VIKIDVFYTHATPSTNSQPACVPRAAVAPRNGAAHLPLLVAASADHDGAGAKPLRE